MKRIYEVIIKTIIICTILSSLQGTVFPSIIPTDFRFQFIAYWFNAPTYPLIGIFVIFGLGFSIAYLYEKKTPIMHAREPEPKGKFFCRYCGAENKPDAAFCERCGKKL